MRENEDDKFKSERNDDESTDAPLDELVAYYTHLAQKSLLVASYYQEITRRIQQFRVQHRQSAQIDNRADEIAELERWYANSLDHGGERPSDIDGHHPSAN